MAIKPNSIVDSSETVLRFMKSRSHMYHLSNIFFRDFHYGIMAYGQTRSLKISYGKAESLASEVIASLENAGILRLIKPGSWMLNYPEFKKPSTKTEAATKPSSGSAGGEKATAPPSSGLASPA